jgi:hypothetical protein
VRTLPASAGEVLRFPLAIAARPHLSFRPITGQDTACRFVVAFEDAAGTRHPLYSELHRSKGRTLPDATTVDLSAHAGELGTLRLEIERAPEVDCAAHWGSPRVIDAIPPPEVHRPARPDVLLLAADTLRADAVGAYGRRPSVTL